MEPSSSSSSSSSADPLKAFNDFLTKEIDDLQRMFQTNNKNFMSIQFLARVLSFTRSCHNQMTHWALILKLPDGGSWFDEYMAESEKLMKASKDIKDCLERMANYNDDWTVLTTFIHANRVLNPQACQQMIKYITDCITRAEALEAENTPLSMSWRDLRLVENLDSETTLHENFGFNGVIYATRNVCKTLLRILLFGLVHYWEDNKFEKYVHKDGMPFDLSFMVSIDRLQQSLESEIGNLTRPSGILWYEYRILKVALDELRREFEMVSEGGVVVNLESEGWINEIVNNLTRCVKTLKVGIEMMIKQIDDFTDEIIEARNKIRGLV